MTEKQQYEVIQKFDGFELRHYPACQLATVTVSGEFASAANRGFYPLVNYISGANQKKEKIAMTAPVLQSSQNASSHEISFVLPAHYSLADLPIPANSQVRVHTLPAHHAVARRFSGRWSEKRFFEQGQLLKLAVNKSIENGRFSASVSQEVYFARFDPPWMPGVARRNEALMQVQLVAKH